MYNPGNVLQDEEKYIMLQKGCDQPEKMDLKEVSRDGTNMPKDKHTLEDIQTEVTNPVVSLNIDLSRLIKGVLKYTPDAYMTLNGATVAL